MDETIKEIVRSVDHLMNIELDYSQQKDPPESDYHYTKYLGMLRVKNMIIDKYNI